MGEEGLLPILEQVRFLEETLHLGQWFSTGAILSLRGCLVMPETFLVVTTPSRRWGVGGGASIQRLETRDADKDYLAKNIKSIESTIVYTLRNPALSLDGQAEF